MLYCKEEGTAEYAAGESHSPNSHNPAIHSTLYFYKRTDLGFVTVLVNQF